MDTQPGAKAETINAQYGTRPVTLLFIYIFPLPFLFSPSLFLCFFLFCFKFFAEIVPSATAKKKRKKATQLICAGYWQPLNVTFDLFSCIIVVLFFNYVRQQNVEARQHG